MKIAKRALALIFVLILSINSFGAISSDNDGSSFITKAEFDSLKNTFQAQIDSYNQGIDSKIDNAIAAYLASIIIQKEIKPENYIDELNEKYDLKWDNNSNGYQTTKPGYKFKVTAQIYFERYKTDNRKEVYKYDGGNSYTHEIVAPLAMPVCNKNEDGEISINYYEKRQTFWDVNGTWDYPWVNEMTTTAAYQFNTNGHIQVLRDTNPCKNINVVDPPQVWCDNMDSTNRSPSNTRCTMVVTGSCSIHTSDKNEDLILINTNSSAKTYWFNLDNDTKCVGNESKYDSGPYNMDNANWQAITSSKWGTLHSLSGAATIGTRPNAETVNCPWSQNLDVSQDMYDARIDAVTKKHKPLKDGVCMFDITSSGHLSFDVTPTATGTVKIYAHKKDAPSTYIINDTYNFTNTNTKHYEFSVGDGEIITDSNPVEFWILYTPSGTARQEIQVKNAKLILTN